MQDYVIKVNSVHKTFRLPHEQARSVKSSFTKLFRHYGRVETQVALRDISFDIKDGEFFGIVGRNGGGKSTLLKILAGIYQPTKGKVNVNGKLVPFIELGVGFNPELTGRENVFLNGALLGFSKQEMAKQYSRIVEFAELEDFMDQKLKNYSSGMQVRLAFSVAIIAEADILLVDEVLAVGDADFQRKCFEYFKRLKRDKKTVIFVSHDMGAVQQYCDRAMLIDDSKVVEIGKPDRIAMLYNKLFMAQESNGISSGKGSSVSGEERWGDGWAEWSKVAATYGTRDKIGEPEYIEIHASGRAKQDVEFPIFGFSIKNAELAQLTGTNTMRKSIKVSSLRKGQKFSLVWRVPNVFNTGQYYVDCTIAHDQATMVSDRWPEAASFNISRVDNNPYLICAGADFEYTANRS
jgi:ABC-2 type transport system ATP-binding protein